MPKTRPEIELIRELTQRARASVNPHSTAYLAAAIEHCADLLDQLCQTTTSESD